MIIFETTTKELEQNRNNLDFFDDIKESYSSKLGRRPGAQELVSWQNSLRALSTEINKANVPDDVIVLIEFTIPVSGARIDAVLCSKDDDGKDTALIIELKQWEIAKASNVKRMVKTHVAGNNLMEHPSAQAINYKTDLLSIDDSFSDVIIKPSSFLHNYVNTEINGLKDVRYQDYIKEAPLFEVNSMNEFRDYLIKNTKGGPSVFAYEIFKNMKYNPSISLRENAAKFSKDITKTFNSISLYGDQTSAFNIIKENIEASNGENLFIVRGAAGTGKTILALKLFLELSQETPTALFFPGSDFRQIISETFNLNNNKDIFGGRIKGMPTKSTSLKKNEFKFGIIDEAHKLPWQSSFSGIEPLIDIIEKIENNLILYDDTQVVSYKSLETLERALTKIRNKKGYNFIELDLKNQFRSLGGNNFIYFIDDVLYNGISNKFHSNDFNITISDTESDFLVNHKNVNTTNKRILSLASSFGWTRELVNGKPYKDISIAGEKFNWYFPVGATVRKSFKGYSELSPKSKRDIQYMINDDEHANDYIAYHNTVQGSEFDHVSVFVGDEIYLSDEGIVLDYDLIPKGSRANFKSPRNLKGDVLKKVNHQNNRIVLNQLKVLLTRSRRSLNIYFKDKKLNEYFKKLVK